MGACVEPLGVNTSVGEVIVCLDRVSFPSICHPFPQLDLLLVKMCDAGTFLVGMDVTGKENS